MDAIATVKDILRHSLDLGSRADDLTGDSPLWGALPEFDSMAVVTVVAAIEDRLGISIDDEDLSGALFATVGSLADFVARRSAND